MDLSMTPLPTIFSFVCFYDYFIASVSTVNINKKQGENPDKSAGHFIILFSIEFCPQQH